MPYSSVTATSHKGYGGKKKKPKAPKPVSVTATSHGGYKKPPKIKAPATVNATLGGSGVKKTAKAKKSFDATVARRAAKEQARNQAKLAADINLGAKRRTRPVKTKKLLTEPEREYERDSGPATLDALKHDISRSPKLAVGLAKALAPDPTDPVDVALSLPILGSVRGLKSIKKLEDVADAGRDVKRVPRKPSPKKAAKKARKSRVKADKRNEAIRRKATPKKERAKQQWKKRKPAVLSKPGRQVKRRKRATALATAGTVSPAAAMVAGGTVQTTGEALVEDPEQTLKTTARVVPGLAAGVVSAAGNVAATGKRLATGEDKPFEPLEGELEAQKRYWEQVGEVASGSPEGKQIVKEDLGLVPVATGALTAAGLAKPFLKPKSVGPEPKGLSARRAKGMKDKAEVAPEKAKAKRDKLKKRDVLGAGERHRQRTRRAKDESMTSETEQAVYSAELRGDKRLDKLARSLDRKQIGDGISLGDLSQIIAREGLDPRSKNFKRELRAVRDSLETPSRQIPTERKHTRRVLDAALELDEAAFRDPELEQFVSGLRRVQEGRQAERAAASGRDTDERARLFHVAQRENVLLPEERIPEALRDVTNIRERKGKDTRKALKQNAAQRRRRAVSLEKVAEALGDTPKAQSLRKRAEANRATSERIAAEMSRFQRAESKEREADRLEAEGLKEEAQDLREGAVKLRREAIDADEATVREFVEEVYRVAPEKARRAVYVQGKDTAREDADILLPDPAAKRNATAKDKRLAGQLAREGRLDESTASLMESLFAQRVRMERVKQGQRLLGERHNVGEKSVFTEAEYSEAVRGGDVPPGYTRVPLQEVERWLAAGKWESQADIGEFADQALRDEIMAAKRKGGRKYVILNEQAKKEFDRQQDSPGGATRAARWVGRIQSAAILATSPAWFAFQLFATPLTAFLSHPNPGRWMKVAKQAVVDYRKLTPTERARFRAMFGGTSSEVLDFRDYTAPLSKQAIRDTSNVLNAAMNTPMGRFMNVLKSGGPLIVANRKYEANLRMLTGLMELDKIENPSRVLRVAHSIAGLTDATRAHVKKLDGMTKAQRLRYYAEHPDDPVSERMRLALDDTLGNWTALSSKEKTAAALTVFYPFLRFSLKWASTFPRNHPIKAAILLNLAQQNAEELERVLDGDVSFFPDWGMAILNTGPGGQPAQAFNAARINPASNALVEALGSGELNLASITRVTQPAIGAVLTAGLAKQDPFTGEALKEGESGWLEGVKGLVELPTPARPFSDDLGLEERTDFQRIFSQISGRDPDSLRDAVVPQLTTDLYREKEAARVGRILDKAETPAVEKFTTDLTSRLAGITDPEEAKRVGENMGREREHANLKSKRFKARLDGIKQAYGITDPVSEAAFDAFFSVSTPSQFGNKSKSRKARDSGSSDSSGSGGGSAYTTVFGGRGSSGGGGGGAYSKVFGN